MMPKIQVYSVSEGIENAINFIGEFLKKNSLEIEYSINFDFRCDILGYVVEDELKNNDFKIYINPFSCEVFDENSESCAGFIRDFTDFGTVIHEFSHILFHTNQEMVSKYKEVFSVDRLWFYHHMSENIHEEMVCLFMIYITNPYLMKHIDQKRYGFFKSFYKPVTAYSKKTFFRIYDSYPYKCKIALKSELGIEIDLDKNEIRRKK